MNKFGKLLLVIVLAVIVIFLVIGSQIYGYSALKTNVTVDEVSPQFNIGLGSIASAVLKGFQGNLLGAASSLIGGLNVQGVLTINNQSLVPLFIPKMKHQITIEGKITQSELNTDSMWLGPGSSKTQDVKFVIDKADIPSIALSALAQGGQINIAIQSSSSIGVFTISKTSELEATVTSPLSSHLLTLTDYDVTPRSISPGGTLTLSYTISNPTSTIQTVGLGASISRAGALLTSGLSDPANDAVVTVSPGTSIFTRSFNIPSDAVSDSFDVVWGIWSGKPGSPSTLYQSRTQNGCLIVQKLTQTTAPTSATPTLVDYDVTPRSISPGGTLTLSYTISNPTSTIQTVGLGASLYLGISRWDDSTNDTVVIIPPGTSIQSRSFKIPTNAAYGTYDVTWGLWSGSPGKTNQYRSQNQKSCLRIGKY